MLRVAAPRNGALLRSTSTYAVQRLVRATLEPAVAVASHGGIAAVRWSSSASSRWKLRQGSDFYAREAKVQGLKSRAAFKLLEVRFCFCLVPVLEFRSGSMADELIQS